MTTAIGHLPAQCLTDGLPPRWWTPSKSYHDHTAASSRDSAPATNAPGRLVDHPHTGPPHAAASSRDSAPATNAPGRLVDHPHTGPPHAAASSHEHPQPPSQSRRYPLPASRQRRLGVAIMYEHPQPPSQSRRYPLPASRQRRLGVAIMYEHPQRQANDRPSRPAPIPVVGPALSDDQQRNHGQANDRPSRPAPIPVVGPALSDDQQRNHGQANDQRPPNARKKLLHWQVELEGRRCRSPPHQTAAECAEKAPSLASRIGRQAMQKSTASNGRRMRAFHHRRTMPRPSTSKCLPDVTAVILLSGVPPPENDATAIDQQVFARRYCGDFAVRRSTTGTLSPFPATPDWSVEVKWWHRSRLWCPDNTQSIPRHSRLERRSEMVASVPIVVPG